MIDKLPKNLMPKSKARPDKRINASGEDNQRFLLHNMEIMKLPTYDKTKLTDIEQRIDDYFKICAKNKMKPTCAGFALAFKTDRITMRKWVTGIESKWMPPEIRNTLRFAYNSINAQMEDYMMNGKINPVAGIFLMKNNMGYTDTQNIEVAPKNPIGEVDSDEVIRQKYIDVKDKDNS